MTNEVCFMGLFSSPLDSKAKKAFQNISNARTATWIPGGVSQAKQLCQALTDVLGWGSAQAEVEDLEHLLTIFTEIAPQFQKMRSPFEIKKALSEGIPMFEGADLYQVIAVAEQFYRDARSSWKEESVRNAVAESADGMRTEEQWILHNSEIANEHSRGDQIGTNVNMPIYTIGVQGELNYLSTLETADGRRLHFEQINSYVVDPKGGSVDEYVGILETGEEYGHLFLNSYCDRTSVAVPKGYRIFLA